MDGKREGRKAWCGSTSRRLTAKNGPEGRRRVGAVGRGREVLLERRTGTLPGSTGRKRAGTETPLREGRHRAESGNEQILSTVPT